MHIETGNGMQIVPNATLAEASFTNLSRPDVAYTETLDHDVREDDAAATVMAAAQRGRRAARPARRGAADHRALPAGGYATSMTLATFAAAGRGRAPFLLRLWYAARRANIALDGADIWKDESTDDVSGLLRQVGQPLRVAPDQVAELAPQLDIERFAPGRSSSAAGQPCPTAMRYIAAGRVALRRPAPTAASSPCSRCTTATTSVRRP